MARCVLFVARGKDGTEHTISHCTALYPTWQDLAYWTNLHWTKIKEVVESIVESEKFHAISLAFLNDII